jgi:CheY-like chemotaxis protein
LAPENSKRIRIAIAEDEPDLRKTFVAQLEKLGHTVICAAANGAELLEGILALTLTWLLWTWTCQ